MANKINLNMRLITAALLLGILSAPAALAVEYGDFPSELQLILDERIAELDTEGGICIAGQVTFSDAAPITSGADVLVNLYHEGLDEPMWVYEDGWFIMGRIGSSYYAGADKGFVLRAFGYDPIDALVTIHDSEMTYIEFEMAKTPPENLAMVEGTIFDGSGFVGSSGWPFPPTWQASVSIYYPFATNGTGTYPVKSWGTGNFSDFSFFDLSFCEHEVMATAEGYDYDTELVTPPAEDFDSISLKIYPNRAILIDYVYQADGSRDFTTGDLQTGTIEWLNGSGGVDFSRGQVAGGDGQDLSMVQEEDILRFEAIEPNGLNGFYDAGLVDFDSLIEAAETGYSTDSQLSNVCHVYVARTGEGNYAKFIIQSFETAARFLGSTGIFGEPAEVDFAGYGLFLRAYCSYVPPEWPPPSCTAADIVEVSKFCENPEGLEGVLLPYIWQIDGWPVYDEEPPAVIMIRFTYDEADITSLGIIENELTVFQSPDNGGSWHRLETARDTSANTLVVDVDRLSWFIVGSENTDILPRVIYVDDDATSVFDPCDPWSDPMYYHGDGASWETAYKYLQDAFESANTGDEIRVAQGTYRPDIYRPWYGWSKDRNSTFQLINGVSIYGGYAGIGAPDPDERNVELHESILTGDLDEDDGPNFNQGENCYHVVTGSGTEPNAILDGFTITRGLAGEPSPQLNSRGGGIYNVGGSPTISNCKMTKNYARRGAPMYNVSGSNPNIVNCMITDNWGAARVGMYNVYSEPTVTGCLFSDNWSLSGLGGEGMYNEYSDPIVSDCTFINNSPGISNDNSTPIVTDCTFTYNGSGISNGDSNPIVTNCSFTENIFGMVNYMSNPEVTDCTFSGNSNMTDLWDGEGGGMHNYQSNPVVTDCNFIGNSADYGGGMYNKWYSEPVLINCTFTENFARFDGGGICNSRMPQDGPTKPTLNNCTFSNNSANGYGGGISNNQSEPNLTDCEFTSNTARDGGGGIYARSGNTLRLKGCTFTENSIPIGYSEFGGGGILCRFSNILNMNNCIFTRNSSGYDSAGGGAIHVCDERSLVTVENCRFDSNFAESGGGILNGGQLNLINCTFTENRSWLGWEGGGAIADWGILTIDNCIFSKNISRDEDGYGGIGGAIFFYDSDFKITNSIFVNNTALGEREIVLDDIYDRDILDTGSGGAVYIFWSSGEIDSCLFTGNSAGYSGGLFLDSTYESEHGILLNNCTVVGNSARYYGGGLFLEWSVDVTNCIIRDNRAQLGPQVASWYLDSTINYCDVEGGEDEVFVWDMWEVGASIDWGQGNIDADPSFVQPGWWHPNDTPTDPNDDFWVDGDYHLKWLSPCVNAGDPCGDYTGQTDMDGEPRVRYGRVDIGADEVFPLGCDFEPDGDVDLADFAAFAIQWQTSGYQAVAKLTASDGQNGDLFGGSVSISGNICVVGASGDPEYGICPGAAYVYRFDGSDWALEQELTAADGQNGDLFGISVSVDGNLCVVGVCGDDDKGDDSGSAYVFRFDGSTWVQEAKLLASDGTAGDWFGCPVSLSGNVCAVLARGDEPYPDNYGSVYIFRFNGTSWVQEDKISALDVGVNSIRSVSVSGDVYLIGTKRFSGELLLGSATTFRFDGYDWEWEQVLSPSSYFRFDFGSSVSIDGNVCVVGDGHYNSGAAYVFRFDGNEWDQEQELLPWDDPSYDLFGASVSISGDVCAVGDSLDGDGSAYVFRYDGSSWTEECKLIPFDGTGENGQFGSAVSVDSENIIVGAPVKDNLTGAAYTFGSGLEADFNGDGSVNMPDLVILAEYWLLQPDQTLQVNLSLNDLWMYQNLPGQTASNLTAAVSIAHDPLGNNSYTYDWEFDLPDDVSTAPVTIDGGGAGDAFCIFAAPGCDQPGGLSDLGQMFTLKVTVTGDNFGNSGQAEAEFGIALLGDVNNDAVVNVADRGIINAFWQAGSAGGFTLRDCDLNCDGVVNVADRSIANAIWQGVLGANSVSEACPLR